MVVISRSEVVGPPQNVRVVMEILVVGSSHVRRMLEVQSEVSFPENVRIRYVGVGGMRLNQVRRYLLTGFFEVNGFQVTWGNPDAVLIATSGNDIKDGQDNTSYLTAYSDLAKLIQEKSTKNPRVIICSPMYRGTAHAEYNRIVSNIFSRDSAMPRVYNRINPAYLLKLNLKKYKLLLKDGIHLGPAGYLKFRKDIEHFLSTNVL